MFVNNFETCRRPLRKNKKPWTSYLGAKKRNLMLANAVESYLNDLEEREFDVPFVALLRALGFLDNHHLHSPFEFGKDFIAKGKYGERLSQFTFQTKGGDIEMSDWYGCRGQIDLLRANSLAHPAFDRSVPRQAGFRARALPLLAAEVSGAGGSLSRARIEKLP
jgi:hypothetical protein